MVSPIVFTIAPITVPPGAAACAADGATTADCRTCSVASALAAGTAGAAGTAILGSRRATDGGSVRGRDRALPRRGGEESAGETSPADRAARVAAGIRVDRGVADPGSRPGRSERLCAWALDAPDESPPGASAAAVPGACGPTTESPRANNAAPIRTLCCAIPVTPSPA